MSITFSTAIRDRVGLLITCAGGTGSGKSLSALRIARGLATKPGENIEDSKTLLEIDSRIGCIDTEAGRLKHYAPAPGELPSKFTFAFKHADMKPPFSPEAFVDAIGAADSAGFEVVIVDSGSHVWSGDGGVQDQHDADLDNAVDRARSNHNGSYPFDEDKTRERLSLGCWKNAKMEHKRFVSKLLQTRAHVILCLRAEEKLRMEQVEEEGANGRKYKKTVITQAKDLPVHERWVPLCEKRLPFEFTVSFLLLADKPGFPIPIKLEEQHRSAVPLDQPLSEKTGMKLAEWARGGAPKPRPIDELSAAGEAIAAQGSEALRKWWTKDLTESERQSLGGKDGELMIGLKKRASEGAS